MDRNTVTVLSLGFDRYTAHDLGPWRIVDGNLQTAIFVDPPNARFGELLSQSCIPWEVSVEENVHDLRLRL